MRSIAKCCRVSLLVAFSVLSVSAVAAAQTRVSSLSEVPSHIKGSYGKQFFREQMMGLARPNAFGNDFPEGVTPKDVIALLMPGKNTSLATLVGIKKWPYREHAYVAITCMAADKEERDEIIKYHDGHPACGLFTSSLGTGRLDVAIAVLLSDPPGQLRLAAPAISWHHVDGGPLSVQWNHTSLDGPVSAYFDKTGNEHFRPDQLDRFDLAAYRLSDTITAFGVRWSMREGYAGGGASFQSLTLFAMVHGKLRAVFSQPMAFYKNLAGEWHKDGTREHILSEGESIVIVSPHTTQGMHDLIVKARQGSWRHTFHWDPARQHYRP